MSRKRPCGCPVDNVNPKRKYIGCVGGPRPHCDSDSDSSDTELWSPIQIGLPYSTANCTMEILHGKCHFSGHVLPSAGTFSMTDVPDDLATIVRRCNTRVEEPTRVTVMRLAPSKRRQLTLKRLTTGVIGLHVLCLWSFQSTHNLEIQHIATSRSRTENIPAGSMLYISDEALASYRVTALPNNKEAFMVLY